jgi:hypothetical protein
MPVGDVIVFVAYIVEHDELPEGVAWIDARGNLAPSRSLKVLRETANDQVE